MKKQEEAAKTKRGFASMSPERQRQIAAEGGRTAHRLGLAHEWTKEEAREAGKKGGKTHAKNRFNRSENDGCDHFL
jgi:general stress protein YciG